MSQHIPFLVYLRRLEIAQRLQTKKRVPYKKLSEEYEVSVRAIKRDVHWIRKQVDLPSVQKIVTDKVLAALSNCDSLKDRKFIIAQGLPFLAKGIPQRVEMESKEESYTKIDITGLNDDDKSILDRAARLLESKGARKPSDLH